ncbi:hypothetical protein SKAU_G00343190 [Synaphobranchus kaupii]|uniref:Uncharacterized protein n=1 Tax=Synaphobranchus kaupii TaxID=118154 RepID=A0A9Q1EIY1_SYNKA|nr:hypothetical protein SKAU_G00343190 [Synaphobranchus kaupii]
MPLTQTLPQLSAAPTEEEQDSEESNSPNGEQAEPHKSSLTQIKEHFTQLEIEQVQLKEMFLKQQTEKDSIQLLLKQITKIKKEQEGTLAAYQKELQQDRECHRKELAALREQVRELQQDRESHRNELIALREELKDRDRTVERQQLHPLTDQGLLTVVNSTQASLDIQTQPGPQPQIVHKMNSPSNTHLQSPPAKLPTQTMNIQCLRPLKMHTSKDFHPHTIQKVNASISRDCALRPNVHLAHHPALSVDDLYDQVHLLKEAVPVLAKTLKDVALNRNSTTSHRSNGQGRTQTPRRTPKTLKQHTEQSRPAEA